jgi:hypothetical protein
MKKLVFSLMTLFTYGVNAQWVAKKIDNGFDAPTKIAYTGENQKAYLKMESSSSGGFFYVGGETYCGEGPVFVEMSFQVNGVNKQYGRVCNLFGEENPIAIISIDILNEDFYQDFKSATTMKIRISDYDCSETIQTLYSFSMSGSTAALNFILKP